VLVTEDDHPLDMEALFNMFYGRLARLLYRVTGDTGAAEEIASEAFWRLSRSPQLDDTNVEGWLYRTGLRLALDGLRKKRRRAYYESFWRFFSTTPSPSDSLEQQTETTRVRTVLAALKAQHAELLLLRADDLDYNEISVALNLHPASVGTLLARARSAFRKEYEKRYGTPQY
jgi:RNA polymerase sigma-70 factor (ECF subfamily)